MKNYCIFATVSRPRKQRHIVSIDGIFYARLAACICKDNKAVQIPTAVIEICQFPWSETGGEQPFLFYLLNFSSVMTKEMKNASSAKHSNAASTSNSTKTVQFNPTTFLINKLLTTKSDVCKFLCLPEKSVSSIDRTDFYDASLHNFRDYEYSLYNIQFNQKN